MGSEVAKIWYLKKIDIFSHLTDEEMDQLSEMTYVQDLPEGQPIFFPGDEADTVYMLKKGRVRISRSTTGGKTITLAILGPGEVFGELALAGGESRNSRAETLSTCFICAVSKDKFQEFLQEHPDINLKVTRMIGDRRREIESRVQQLIFHDGPSRLAQVLLDLFDKHAEDEDADHPEIRFSHDEIANLIGLTRPTTTKFLNEFEDEGLVELGRKTIQLRDYAGLKRNSQS